ncbi:LysR substrate-binding domain-containing protein (plasmid) [Rhizobium sp. 32-5/1]|uniref:LysR substrate-binding domain-containing protein n=1 Tax=Rhizobium sp. 32-5/1 TaxID=3019602 RepID=UPI00240D9E6E|nr:LysR substrate-binding domain-containing protein [Rhizobium sp. 32-5/1]WEZ85468.1 LysR substrate-binding domain-containing protein [Rhizobium sp. 32-5/1]
MHLTQEGEELLSRVSGLVAQLEKSIEDVRSLSSKPAGQVALGLIPSVSDVVAGRVAMRVARDYPDISLRIVEAYAGHLIDWLHRGDIDAALIYGPSTDLHLRMRELFFEELVLVSPASICLPGDKLRVETLGEMKLVLPSRPHGLRLVVEAAAEKARVHLNVRYEADLVPSPERTRGSWPGKYGAAVVGVFPRKAGRSVQAYHTHKPKNYPADCHGSAFKPQRYSSNIRGLRDCAQRNRDIGRERGLASLSWCGPAVLLTRSATLQTSIKLIAPIKDL